MKDIQKLSLLVSVLGLVLTYFASDLIAPKLTKITDLNSEGEYVKVEAIVVERTERDSNWILKLQDDTGSINAVIWKTKKLIPPSRGAVVSVSGFVKDYKGELQIEVEKLDIGASECCPG